MVLGISGHITGHPIYAVNAYQANINQIGIRVAVIAALVVKRHQQDQPVTVIVLIHLLLHHLRLQIRLHAVRANVELIAGIVQRVHTKPTHKLIVTTV